MEILIAVMGILVTAMVIAGMVLMTPGNIEAAPKRPPVPVGDGPTTG